MDTTVQDMEGLTAGIWSAHGEGRAHFPDPKIQQLVEAQNLAPIRFGIYPLRIEELWLRSGET